MDKNICKFISPGDQSQLTVTNFMYETQPARSGEECTLHTNVLYIAEDGEGILSCGAYHNRIVAGTVFFTFADIPFTIENTGELKYYCISFCGGRAEELFRRFGLAPDNCVFEGFRGLVPFWKDNLVRSDDDNIDLLSESLLLYTFSKLKKNEHSSNAVVNFVLAYLEEHFTESGLSLSDVATAAGYHEKYLSHVFKKHFGMGFSEYLRLLRIKYAVTLIENGVTSVKNVAHLSGFSDPFYFSRVFTKAIGVSPREYRKNGQEEPK